MSIHRSKGLWTGPRPRSRQHLFEGVRGGVLRRRWRFGQLPILNGSLKTKPIKEEALEGINQWDGMREEGKEGKGKIERQGVRGGLFVCLWVRSSFV